MSNLIAVTFTSVWEDGSEITTPATLDMETGKVEPEASNSNPDGNLIKEYVTIGDNELNVCSTCHEYLTKEVMIPDQVGNGLHEETACRNQTCDSHN